VSHTSKGKGKQKIDYASSLEGTHGSASEAEVVRRLLCRNNLAALGDWADAELHPTRVLRGSARAKDRQHNYRRSKNKKPVLVLQHEHRAHGHDGEHAKLMVASSPSYGGTGKTKLTLGGVSNAHSRDVASSSVVHDPGHDEPSVRLAEEGQQQLTLGQTTQLKSLSRARKYSIMGLITLMGCTVLAAAYATHLTGRSHMSCTRCIVFAATVALAFLTVLAMLIARRALSEALLAGLLELVFGFALLAELNDIM
jgi:uncharacterized membrane protein (GlpM family)